MLKSIKLENFKNFQTAELSIRELTTLIGTNAVGKSNVLDAFRFLHGIGRGYTLSEIAGEKFGVGGELQWSGIRGGPREIAYRQSDTFQISLTLGISELYNAPVLDNLEARANEYLSDGRVLIAENAWQEIEVWILAGHELPNEWSWQEVRGEPNPKELYFQPIARQRNLLQTPGQGRKVLAQEASNRLERICQLCPEVASLQTRIS